MHQSCAWFTYFAQDDAPSVPKMMLPEEDSSCQGTLCSALIEGMHQSYAKQT